MIIWCVKGEASHLNGSVLDPNARKYIGCSNGTVHNFIHKESITNELSPQCESEDVALGHNIDHGIAIDKEVDMNEQSKMTAIREALTYAISVL